MAILDAHPSNSPPTCARDIHDSPDAIAMLPHQRFLETGGMTVVLDCAVTPSNTDGANARLT